MTKITVLDPSTEEGAKALINVAKASVQPQNAAFLSAVRAGAATAGIDSLRGSGRLAGSLSISDSTEARGIAEGENSDAEVEPQAPTETLLSPEAVRGVLEDAIATSIAPVQEKLDAATTEAEALRARLEAAESRNTELQSSLVQARNAETILAELGKLTGKSSAVNTEAKKAGMPAFVSGNPNREHPHGLASGLLNIIEKESKSSVERTRQGQVVNKIDPRKAQAFILNSMQADLAQGRSWRSSEIVKSVEAWAKDIGFLQGTDATRGAGPTTGAAGSAPSLFLDMLSALTRATHTSMNVWWQFAMNVYDPTSAPSKTVLVPRWAYLADPTALSDYELSGYDSFTPVGLTIGTSTDSQNLVETDVPIGIRQYGLGKATAVGTRPIYIPEFHEAISLTSLIDIVDSRLMQNYYKFENLLVRLRYEANTKIWYNDKGLVTTTATNLTTGDGGGITRRFLHSVNSNMFAAQVPTYPDGRYVAVLCPDGIDQLRADLEEKWQPPGLEEIQEVTNMMTVVHGIEMGRVSGYVGDYCGFRVFADNSFGVGTAGATPTVNNVTFEAAIGARVTNDNFVFGPGAVGRGTAMPVQVRSSGTVPFDMGEAFIWLSWEGVGDLDNDAAISAAQQTRVYKLRTARVPF